MNPGPDDNLSDFGAGGPTALPLYTPPPQTLPLAPNPQQPVTRP